MNKIFRLFFIFFLATNATAQVTQYRAGLQPMKDGDNEMRLNHFLKAYEHYTTAVTVDPTLADAWYKRSEALTKMARYKEALADQNKAMLLNPNIANLYDSRAQLRMLAEDYPGAVEDLTKAIADNPLRTELYHKLANAHLATGDYEAA
ncbi:MAG: tetratricopeptide repeat protein [Bacteroidia bacterium]